MRFLFGEWKPDQPAHLSDGLSIAEGCMAIANGYAPVGQFAPVPNGALPAPAIGAAAYRYAGVTYVFGGTTSAIYRYASTGHAALRTGLNGTTAMRFCPYGKFMLATNGVDPIQRFDPAAPSTIADLAGGAPTANYLAVVRGFLVAGYAGGSALRVQWSDTGDPTAWAFGGASLAGEYDMPSGGDITGVVGGEYGLIFQERRIVRMSYTGDADDPWQWDEISTNVGCIAPWSLTTWGRLTFFLSDKGFMACDGASVTPIGDEKVDRTFTSRAQPSFYEAMSAAIDPVNSLYVVTLPSTSPTTVAYLYNYNLQRWTSMRVSAERLFQSFAQNASLEDLDAIYGSLDAMPVSLDSPSFRGGKPLLMFYNDAHTLGVLAGTPQAATFQDAKREMLSGRRSRLRSVRPLTDAAKLSITIGGQNGLAGSPSTTTYMRRASGGVYRTREAWNLMQMTLGIAAGEPWSFCQGIDADATAGGRA